MKYNGNARMYGWFYHSACKVGMKRMGRYDKAQCREIKKEYKQIVLKAKDIGKFRLLNAYFMGAYFIALNRVTECSAEENYQFFQTGLYNSRLFRMAIGNADAYLGRKKLLARLLWVEQSQKRRYENDWFVDILDKTADFELGYDYHMQA